MEQFKGTTIVAVKKGNETVIAGDGQVTMSNSAVMKSTAKKVRRIFDDKVVIGFAGSVADAFSLSSRFEEMLNKFAGNLTRSAVELASQFRLDEIMRKLEALMIVADKDKLLIIDKDRECQTYDLKDYKGYQDNKIYNSSIIEKVFFGGNNV
ncbi:MAG: ATP-dependent protease subunit HslV [Clostridia bacterium]|nr:ATP-dependent protease subunit HslV [Clostridia bacterium]